MCSTHLICTHLAIIIKFVNLYCLIQDPPKEEDLSFLEWPRLEAEYLKLKEQKRKAEQYAIEAKQTAPQVNMVIKEDYQSNVPSSVKCFTLYFICQIAA